MKESVILQLALVLGNPIEYSIIKESIKMNIHLLTRKKFSIIAMVY